jgi:hypothetical protein
MSTEDTGNRGTRAPLHAGLQGLHGAMAIEQVHAQDKVIIGKNAGVDKLTEKV